MLTKFIYFTPSKSPTNIGLGLGLIGSETYCNLKCRRDSYGIGIQLIGQGFFQAFMIKKF